jgi:ABC-2 type transport system ATP-binding protein
MIEVKKLSKRFGEFTAVDDLSFSVVAGEVLGFLGPNGAGKSTTMKMITGFLAPSAGSISVCGHSIGKDAIAAKKLMGYLPEGAPSYGDMTVTQFLKFVGDIRGLKGVARSRAISEAVEQIDLGGVVDQSIETLSKGLKRRVGLAQAILHDPKVLILDEPTDGLDPNQKHQVRQLIKNLSQEKIVIVSTHILEEVSAVCSRAIVISNGKLVRDSKPADLESESRYHCAVILKLADDSQSKVLNSLSQQPYVDYCEIDDENNIVIFPLEKKQIFTQVNSLILEESWPVASLSVDKGRLDDVFRKVTGGA